MEIKKNNIRQGYSRLHITLNCELKSLIKECIFFSHRERGTRWKPCTGAFIVAFFFFLFTVDVRGGTLWDYLSPAVASQLACE